jgi:hypothetical protein
MGEPIVVADEKDLRAKAPLILRRINQAERGGLLFLLNPVFALEEVGVTLSPAMKRHIRMGLRYGAEDKKRIKQLEADIGQMAGRPINPAADAEVADLLFNRLALKKPTLRGSKTVPVPGGSASMYEPIDRTPLNAPVAGTAEVRSNASKARRASPAEEPLSGELLQALEGSHPVVAKLAEVRALYERGWQFMNREHYDRARNGATVSLVRSVCFKTKPETPSAHKLARPVPVTKIGEKLAASVAMKRALEPLRRTFEKRTVSNVGKGA